MVLQSIVNRSQNISDGYRGVAGEHSLSAASQSPHYSDDDSFPRTDLDHCVPATRMSRVAPNHHETIPEEEDEDLGGIEGGAQEGIVDDDLEVNMTKQEQVR